MKLNVGNTERMIRMGLGVVLVLIGFLGGLSPWIMAALIALGVIAIITGAVQFCPLWSVLGINTFGSNPSKKA